MAEDQIIYLSPEDELTNVRERLLRIQARRVTFVVPAGTQLRSHVSWKVLHSRARELDKEVTIISSDSQIRSVAKAAGFKVADSHESAPSGRARTESRMGRSSRASQRTRQAPGRTPGGQQKQQPRPPASPTSPNIPYGAEYEYKISPASSLHAVPPREEDEDFDPFEEDYKQSQLFRSQVAQEELSDKKTASENKATHFTTPETPTPRSDTTPDIFDYMHDEQTLPFSEQQGHVPFRGLDEDQQDSSYRATPLIVEGDIEYLGDEGNIVADTDFKISPSDEQILDDTSTRRTYGARTPNRQEGAPERNASKYSSTARPSLPRDIDSADSLPSPSISDMPTRDLPANLPRPSMQRQPTSGYAAQSAQPLQMRPPSAKMPSVQQQSTRKQLGSSDKAIERSASKKPARRRNNRAIVISFVSLLVLLLVLGGLAYLVPSADITVTLAAQTFNAPTIQLTASTTSQQDGKQQTVPTDTLTSKTITLSDSATATGSRQVGTVAATGKVVFTNKGATAVEVPSGLVLKTSQGIAFVTQADAIIPSASNTSAPNLPVPITAMNPGQDGNVAANTITVIPDSSLTQIQSKNPGLSSITITVTNPEQTTGGGVGNETYVSSTDVANEKAALEQKAQAQLKNWVAQQLHSGDMAGQTFAVENFTVTPAVGQKVDDGTFTANLVYHESALVVRKAQLQMAANVAFSNLLLKQKPGFLLVPGQNVTVTQPATTPGSDGKSFILTFAASGPIAHSAALENIPALLAGKNPKDAQHILTGPGGSSDITNVVVNENPGFFPWLPFWANRISVHFVVKTPK